MNENKSILGLRDISLNFGGLSALSGIDLDLFSDEILAIIGPNGAGKTSVLNCISGLYHPWKGEIYFCGRKIDDLPVYKRSRLGLARVFQNVLQTSMTVLDTIMVARQMFMKRGVIAGGLYYGWAAHEESQHRRVVEEIITFLELQPNRKKVVATLPYGVRKRVDFGRALVMEPKCLLLDEPMAGMSAEEKEDIARFILDIREAQQIPIIIVEHDMGLVMDISDRVFVMDFGQKVAEGKPEEVANNPKVISAYLGDEKSELGERKA